MYHKILVPLDGSPLSEAALDHVHQVAGSETEVLLLRVLDVATGTALVTASAEITPVPPLAASPQTVAVLDAAAAKAFQDAEEHLNAKALTLHGQVRATRSLVLGGGDPAAVIVDVAKNEQVDLILMSTHGHSGIVRWVVGSVAEKVLHATHCPLLLIRPGQPTA